MDNKENDIDKIPHYNGLKSCITPGGSYEKFSHKMTDYYGLKEYFFNGEAFYAFKDLPKTLEYLEMVDSSEKIKAIKFHRYYTNPRIGLRESKNMIDAFMEESGHCQKLKVTVKVFLDLHPEYLV